MLRLMQRGGSLGAEQSRFFIFLAVTATLQRARLSPKGYARERSCIEDFQRQDGSELRSECLLSPVCRFRAGIGGVRFEAGVRLAAARTAHPPPLPLVGAQLARWRDRFPRGARRGSPSLSPPPAAMRSPGT